MIIWDSLYIWFKEIYSINSLLINSLLNNKFLGWSKFKAIADGEINVNQNLKIVLRRVENIVNKEKAGY